MSENDPECEGALVIALEEVLDRVVDDVDNIHSDAETEIRD